MSERHLLLYDRDCGFCRVSLSWVLRWDLNWKLEPLALQDPRAEELLADVDEHERIASSHVITPSGRRYSAGATAPVVLRLLPGGKPLAALADRLPRLSERAYLCMASHRSLLGKWVGEGAKRRADSLIDERQGSLAPDPVLVEGAGEQPEDDQPGPEQQQRKL
ncbi:MAG: thiol-disulfide oxidoreductase DCC family protein [Solirubrobacterales bacterium]